MSLNRLPALLLDSVKLSKDAVEQTQTLGVLVARYLSRAISVLLTLGVAVTCQQRFNVYILIIC